MRKALVGAAAAALIASATAQDTLQPALTAARAALAAFAQKDVQGFASVAAPWRFRFPADHAVHPEHRTESWRFSGSLASADGRQFGFRLVFLRVGVTPPAVAVGPSSWAARDVYWAELRLTDAASGADQHFEKLERAAAELSGARAEPTRVWVHDWFIEVHDAERFTLRAAGDERVLELSLLAAKPPVARTADAFHGYVVSRLRATGTLAMGGRTLEVQGLAWLDHAWGSVPMPVGAVVWDRFLVQLRDGRDIMAVRLRRRDGSGEPRFYGLLVPPDGRARVLEAGDLAVMRAGGHWRLSLPREKLELLVQPHAGESGPGGVQGSDGSHAYVELAADAAAPR